MQEKKNVLNNTCIHVECGFRFVDLLGASSENVLCRKET